MKKVVYKRGPYKKSTNPDYLAKIAAVEKKETPAPIASTPIVDLFPAEEVSYIRRKNNSSKLDLLMDKMERMEVSKDVCITIPNSVADLKEAKSLFNSAKKVICRKTDWGYASTIVYGLDKSFQVLRIWRIA